MRAAIRARSASECRPDAVLPLANALPLLARGDPLQPRNELVFEDRADRLVPRGALPAR